MSKRSQIGFVHPSGGRCKMSASRHNVPPLSQQIARLPHYDDVHSRCARRRSQWREFYKSNLEINRSTPGLIDTMTIATCTASFKRHCRSDNGHSAVYFIRHFAVPAESIRKAGNIYPKSEPLFIAERIMRLLCITRRTFSS